MEQIYQSLKELICPELIEKAANVVDENKENVSKAVSYIFAGFLEIMHKHGDTPQIKNIFDEAGNLNILDDIGSICEEKLTMDQQNLGDNFLQQLLGDRAADFTELIAKKAEISKVATNRLISILAPVFVGYIGNKMVEGQWSMKKLIDEIEIQKSSYRECTPEHHN